MPPTRRSRDDDTIVVKGDGDEEWAAPSSPESVGSDIDFEPKNKMANDTPIDLESPEPEQADGSSIAESSSPSRRNGAPPKYLNQISYRDPSTSTMEERLQMMPAKRSLPWREGVEAGSELETGGDSRRKQIRFGCLLATRGNIVDKPCLSCENSRGKFEFCIALPGFFKGACASCQLSGRPNRCSIKSNEDIEPDEFGPEDGIHSSPVPEDLETGLRRDSGSGSQKYTAKETPDRSSSKTHTREDVHLPPAKRARVEEPEKVPQTGWQEPPVVDSGLGSSKSRAGRTPRSSLNNVTSSWAHVNSPQMTTRNSSTPVNTRNGGLRKSVGQASSSEKEKHTKEPVRKPSNTPGIDTPQAAPSRSASTGWASVNKTRQESTPTFPNLPKPQIPKPRNQQAAPEQQQSKSEQQQQQQQQESKAQQQESKAQQHKERHQAEAQQQQQQQQQQHEQRLQHQHQHQLHQAQLQQQQFHGQLQQLPPPHGQFQPPPPPHDQFQPPPPPHGQFQPPPPPHDQFQQFPPQFQVPPNIPINTTYTRNLDPPPNGRIPNGSPAMQPEKRGKPPREYTPSFVTTPGGLSFASAPLIETLPKRKQLQLMGIISGLQGGIDNIQRELNQLRKTLGMEEDDN